MKLKKTPKVRGNPIRFIDVLDLLPVSVVRDLHRVLRDFDNSTNSVLSKRIDRLERFISEHGKQAKICFITDEHLTLAISRLFVLKMNKIIPLKALYSNKKYDLPWVLSEIKLKYGADYEYSLVGYSQSLRKFAEREKWHFIKL